MAALSAFQPVPTTGLRKRVANPVVCHRLKSLVSAQHLVASGGELTSRTIGVVLALAIEIKIGRPFAKYV